MCVGCQQSANRAELERFIYHDEVGLVFDMRKKAPGRGAYAHPSRECLTQAASRGGFSRAFKTRVSVDAAALVEEVQRGVHRRLIEGLRVALSAQKLYIGAAAVAEAVKAGDAALLILAEDASEGTRKKFLANAGRKQLPVRHILSAEELGALCGRELVSVLAAADFPVLRRICRDIERLNALDEGDKLL